ncbi:MAG: Arginine--tRNA ligase [Verrucomicrobia bacterium ADurb.Bin345]|nr:MAG: Arginine--tRNA ligase [Verrucomicrobia bacterium ADurb.Bin345]
MIQTIDEMLTAWMRAAFTAAFPDIGDAAATIAVVPTASAENGDYQCNQAMTLAKVLRKAPRQIAEGAVKAVAAHDAVESVEVAGPGFINIRLRTGWLARTVEGIEGDARCGTPGSGQGKTVVLDYSSPNVAKPMHIGHIRSTVIGSALDRLHRFLGYRVIADNHLGDWGTQFGILVLGWKRELDEQALKADPITELERIYKATHAACEADPAQRELARQELVRLQQGDAENLTIWETMQHLSQDQFNEMYQRLDVRFDVTLGESFYNPRLAGVVESLVTSGVARESLGAIGVFSDGGVADKDDPFRISRNGEWIDNPCLVRKSDGGFNYATTDLATLTYRVETWSPETILYVTDGRQQLHFRQIFAIFRRWRPDVQVRLEHIWFGSILGADGKPFRTRSGETVKLRDLLDEAEERAFKLVTEKSPDVEERVRRDIARAVGLGAVKYADLMTHRQSDYVFNWDKMLSLEGNTAPYLQYACARIASVQDKYGERFPGRSPADQPIVLGDPMERRLAARLLQFPDVVLRATNQYKPNVLTDYLYDLAQVYSAFYQNVPFLKAEDGVRESRVRLCDVTAKTLRVGLGLLGIEAPDRI